MLQIAGIACVFIMVFGGYLIHGGSLEPIIHAAPFELIMILGAGVGAFLLGSSGAQAKAALGSFGKVFGGPKWKKQDYRDLLSLLFTVTKTMKSKGMIALEPHIENPNESAIFKRYPKILHDHFALDFICDTLRMMTMSLEDPHQVETAMEKQLEKHHHESSSPAEAMQSLADGLPALGIVAAVLGIVKTMGAITEPPAVLGAMIGGALVGTFLGVFLAYGFIGPMASRLKFCYDQEALFYHVIRDVLVAHLHGNSAQVSVEIGRGSVPTVFQPSFMELEEALKTVPNES
ncbi:MAG: flagellar motor stator protein MotA [Alphaproteobacteria bacterium]